MSKVHKDLAKIQEDGKGIGAIIPMMENNPVMAAYGM
jgi:hypothetical protein